MYRWCVLLLCCFFVIPAFAVVEIIDVPPTVEDEQYDLTWDMTVQTLPTAPLTIEVEQGKNGHGYQLCFENDQVSWQQVGVEKPLPAVVAPLKFIAGTRYAMSFKRRPETLALLLNHRLLFCAPAPALGKGTLTFRTVPTGITIGEARYRVIGKRVFGDDFMRPGSQRTPAGKSAWVEDTTWKVAYYRKDTPGQDPHEPGTGAALVNPWKLHLFSAEEKAANGFWLDYAGTGVSWVIAQPTMVYPSSDRYFLEAAIQPECDSEVGIIAAYQDNKNYLLFRWKQRDYAQSKQSEAELIAVINGEPKVLATHPRGFDPGQWYTIRINLGWQRVQALVDGVLLMDAENPGPVEGRIGLYAENAASPRSLKMNEVNIAAVAGTGVHAEAARTAAVVRFDNVRMGDWNAVQGIAANSPYQVISSGKWSTNEDVLTAQSTGYLLTGAVGEDHYIVTARVKIPTGGNAVLLYGMNAQNEGYAWVLTPQGQKLQWISGDTLGDEITRSTVGVKAGEWADLRIEADGSMVTLYCNDTPVIDHFERKLLSGRCGIMTTKPGMACTLFSITPFEKKRRTVEIRANFKADPSLAIWASPESEWYPVGKPKNYVVPGWLSAKFIGPAAPARTDDPGLYWHKGGHYRNVFVAVPVSPQNVNGQVVYLATDYDPATGYSLKIDKDNGAGKAQILRNGTLLGEYSFRLAENIRLVFEHRGDYLLLTAQELDPEQNGEEQVVRNEEQLAVIHDADPLHTEMVGFQVTTSSLPAAQVYVESDSVQETFKSAPVNWVTGSGTWAQMSRYACDPEWNWFGGYGVNIPTVWCKYRLDGKQTVEVYNAVKMQFDGALEEYSRRFRDLNMAICTDGIRLNSGYTLIRGGRPGGRTITMLLRKGVVVQTTTEPENLVPGEGQSGHHTWFAERLEKRGGEIKVFIDNHLAMTYQDADPLPGGYVAFWTINNGMMIGRTNFSAEKMTIGTPRAAAPLAFEETMPPRTAPAVSLNGSPVSICTFADGSDGWKARPGISARLLRVRATEPGNGPETFLKVVNMYPGGDFSVTASATPCDLAVTPWLHVDYRFDAGAQLNLYVRKDETWYAFLLTGKEAQQQDMVTAARLFGYADGNWHHLAVNLAAPLQAAITKLTGKAPADLTVQEIVFADWSALPNLRYYGFCSNQGGMAACYANFTLLPAVKGAATLSWQAAGGQEHWRVGVDTQSIAQPTTNVAAPTFTVPFHTGLRFFHLEVQGADGKSSMSIHVPLQAEK